MKFGKVDNPKEIDFTILNTYKTTLKVINDYDKIDRSNF